MGEVKLKTVLNCFLNGNFIISDSEKAEIIKNVKDEASVTHRLTTNTNIYINWMEMALSFWEHGGPTEQPLIFLMDILIEFSENKIIFILLHQSNIYKRLIHLLDSFDYAENSGIARTYIKFLDAFTQTDFGKNWIVSCFDCWKKVFDLIETKKYTDELSVFVKDLFLNVVDSSELFSIDLSKLILNPLISVCSRISGNDLNGVVEEDLFFELVPTIHLLTSVIKCISENVTLDCPWLNHCNNLLQYQKPLKLLLEILEGEEFILELSNFLIALKFLELKQYSNTVTDFLELFIGTILRIMDINLNHLMIDNVTLLSYEVQIYWHHICKFVDISKLNLTYDFSLSMIMFQTSGLTGICMKILGEQITTIVEKDELREDYVWNVMKMLNRTMLSQVYKYRDIYKKKDDFMAEAILAMDYINKTLKFYNKECQKSIFTMYVFYIGDFLTDIQKRNGLNSPYYNSKVITHMIESFIFFVETCDITWKDVVTHMLPLVISLDLLQIEDLPHDLILAILKMLGIAIEKHMAPDFTLLMDCNSMMAIGPLLAKKMKCEDVEVRCAAIKVLLTISESAKTNYPFFQNVLLKSKIPQQLLNISTNETVEIRIIALKCLQHLFKIASVWEEISSVPNILNIIINSLKTQTENQLRSEMVNLVVVIYEEDYFNEVQVKDLYEIMTRLGAEDFEIAVRINSLKFWDNVIKKFLVEEGMIDGGFPEVTFSRNSRKIVVLDQDEIQRRLKRLMRKLSDNGGLTVLNCCFTSNEELEKQCADEIIDSLLKILRKYHIDYNNIESSNVVCKKSILDELELKNLSPKQFLKNVTQPAAIVNNFVEPDDVTKFLKILDQILKHNNIDELDTLDSYL